MLQGESQAPDVDEICFPGDKIPEWFEHQTAGHEINVEIDRQADWCNSNFLGFAFCVVVEFQDVSSDTDFQLHCQSECIFSNGNTNKRSHSWTWHWNYLQGKSTINSSHIFVFHYYCSETYWNFPTCEASSSTSTLTTYYYNNPSATFSFRPKDSKGHVTSWNCEVQGCGVRLLSTHDLEKFHFFNRRDLRDLPSETEDPVTVGEERNNSTHATNGCQGRSFSCDCLLCCSHFRGKVFSDLPPHFTYSFIISIRPSSSLSSYLQSCLIWL